MDKQKNCTNCRYFQRLYYLNVSLRYCWTMNGYCVNGITEQKEFKNCFKKKIACEQWGPYEKQIEQRHEKIESLIKDMAQKLDDIQSILSEDNEYLKRYGK